tara:strand:+ start:910 stop:1899 length:990 start_codon:yes stop_codon:yes gene_type:complete
MEFFDRKQDVMDVEITPLGKRLMQLGQFKPKYYAFYDNDILYDGNYAGTTEVQNDIQERIKVTPRIKQQVYLYSAEGKINSNTTDSDLMIFDENLFQDQSLNGMQTLVNEYNLQREESKQRQFEMYGPLGNMAFHADSIPAWNIDFFEAKLTGSTTISTGSNNERIPTLECDLQYKFKIKTVDEEDPSFVDLSNEELWVGMTTPTEDGSYLLLKGDALFIKVAENNTQFLNDNFDIEVYRVDSKGEEEKLFYTPIGSMLASSPETVNYWFDVMVDSEIPNEIYCKAVKSEKLDTTYTDKFIFDCDDLVQENIAVDQIYEIPDDEVEICD